MKLAVNVDHFATIREARRSHEPEPSLAALLAEQAGADGVVCHLRGDRRHIKEKDLKVLREVIKTKLNLEMAATEEMKKIAFSIKPDIVSLVPEREEELTTEGGLDVLSNEKHLTPFILDLKNAGIKVSIFVDPDLKQIAACHKVGVERQEALAEIKKAAERGHELGLEIHAGHGLDYKNVLPVAAIPEIKEFSIGFSIVARSAMVGIEKAVKEMIALIEKY
jgi:pyridoxine 5-phosphate synthase